MLVIYMIVAKIILPNQLVVALYVVLGSVPTSITIHAIFYLMPGMEAI